MNLKIAIISDLHCKCKDDKFRTTYLHSDMLPKPISHHPIESIKKKIKEEKISCDYLLCLGDISDKIDQQGIVSGWGYIKEVAAVLNISEDKIISVIGNHDIDSRKLHPYPSFNHIITSLDNIPISDEILCEQFWSKKYIIKEYSDLIVLAYNSVFNHSDEEKAKNTIIEASTLERISEELKEYIDNEKPKIAISHHHPIQISNLDFITYKEGDLIVNGDKFLELLSKNNFSLFIHGHKHIPNLEYRNNLPIFGSGSFSSLENLKYLSLNNTFHILEIFCEKERKSPGHIQTFEFFFGRGWRKNTDDEGFFPTDTGFGYTEDILTLSHKIIDWVKIQNKSLLKFENLIDEFEEIKFLIPDQQDSLQEYLLKLGNIRISPSLRASPIEIVNNNPIISENNNPTISVNNNSSVIVKNNNDE